MIVEGVCNMLDVSPSLEEGDGYDVPNLVIQLRKSSIIADLLGVKGIL